MKRKLKSIIVLIAAGLLSGSLSVIGQTSPPPDTTQTPANGVYVISVPPGWKQDHKTVRDGMHAWMSTREEFKNADGSNFDPANGSPFDGHQGFYVPRAGGNLFTAHLSGAQAKALDNDFRMDGKKLIVHPSHEFQPCPLEINEAGIDGDFDEGHVHILSQTTWGDDAAVAAAITTRPALRVPVLYVVDTGVQPIVPTATGATTYKWNPQFSAASGATPKLIFLQGRLAPSLGRSWQFTGPTPNFNSSYAADPDAPATTIAGAALPPPWNVLADSPLVWGGSTVLAPCPKTYDTTIFLDPQRDDIVHGTPITSCAVGTSVGVLGKITGLTCRVESIRVYNNPTTPTATIVEGIYRALDAHKIRVANQGANDPAPVSVLLLASRSTTGYDQSLEVALWWAWYNGMVCIVSAGNEQDPYDTTVTPNKYPPEAQWFPPGGTPLPTSPSRFDWRIGSTPAGKTYWDALGIKNDLNEPVAVPDKPYLIMVGADNSTFAVPTNDGWSPSASKGPGVDILGPSLSLPCSKNVYSTLYANGDCLMTASGASITTGYVAGVALAYLASVSEAKANPTDFRNWLLPDATIPPAAQNTFPIKLSTTAQSMTGTAISPLYLGKMPVLRVTSLTVWP